MENNSSSVVVVPLRHLLSEIVKFFQYLVTVLVIYVYS